VNARLIATIAVSFVLFAGCLVASAWKLGRLDPNILHLQLTFSEDAFRAVLEAWRPEGVARFRSHFAWDYGTLASYAVFGSTAGRWVVEQVRTTGPAAMPLPWLLAVAATADFAENLLHLRFIGAASGELAPVLYVLAGTCASTKWALLLGWPLLAAFLLLRPGQAVPIRPTTR